MKRRRFITVSSILAIVLSLATIGYSTWLLRSGFIDWGRLPFPVHITNLGPLSLSLSNPPGVIELSWLYACSCGSRHWGMNCSGEPDTSPSPQMPIEFVSDFRIPRIIAFSGTLCGRVFTADIKFHPLLPVPFLAAYPALYFLIAGLRRFRRRPGHCLKCDYDLTGNESGVCPECGTAIASQEKASTRQQDDA